MLRRSSARPWRLGGGAGAVVPLRRPAVWVVIGAVGIAVLTVQAVRADAATPAATGWTIGADLAVALAFIIAGAAAPGPVSERALVVAVGAAWLLGSWWPAAGAAHQGVLTLALVAFPSGRPSGRMRWLLLGVSVPLAAGVMPQPPTAALFAVIGMACLLPRRLRTAMAWYPAASALGIAAVLAGSWTLSRIDPSRFDPSLALIVYQAVLTAVAVGFSFAARRVIAGKIGLANRILTEKALAGLGGLTVVLADALDDPRLQVYRWWGPHLGYRTAGWEPPGSDARRKWLEVTDGTGPVAAVEYRPGALDDHWIADAVIAAVRSAVVHLRLTEDLQAQLTDLETARARTLLAANRQRETTAARLREEVVSVLRPAAEGLRTALPTIDDADASDALKIVAQELAGAESEVLSLVAGVPPAQLGNGRLREAIEDIADHSAIPVRVSAAPGTVADAITETALFYVCSEALTNATKHANAARIDVTIDVEGDFIVLRVCDDGRGGADRSGPGLVGLADRMATHGGQLLVESPPGAGTTVTARIRRSSATV